MYFAQVRGRFFLMITSLQVVQLQWRRACDMGTAGNLTPQLQHTEEAPVPRIADSRPWLLMQDSIQVASGHPPPSPPNCQLRSCLTFACSASQLFILCMVLPAFQTFYRVALCCKWYVCLFLLRSLLSTLKYFHGARSTSHCWHCRQLTQTERCHEVVPVLWYWYAFYEYE